MVSSDYLLLILLHFVCILLQHALCAIPQIEIWTRFELTLQGPKENSTNNPFEDYSFGANFTINNVLFYVHGFYNGDANYTVRFMPNTVGIWNYVTWSNVASLNASKGQFNCTPASANNFGVAYVNKSRSTSTFTWSQTNNAYLSVGTTSYSLLHYPDPAVLNETLKTLASLANTPTFNKLRLLLFPMYKDYTHIEPLYYPYVSNGGLPQNTSNWNFRKFNLTFWHYLDSVLSQMLSTLNNGNFVVDLILFHPYDYGHWGFDCMGGRNAANYNTSNDRFYLKYAVSRLASYRNVWWSMANEFNSIECKSQSLPNAFPIWDDLFAALLEYDPYDGQQGRVPTREKSMHQNGSVMYNYSQPYMTHFSVAGFEDVPNGYFQRRFNLSVSKPVILDSVGYEGNASVDDLSAAAETDRFWMANANGNMCGHSEEILPNSSNDPNATSILWQNFGSLLRGSSYDKIGWFYRYMSNVNNHPPFDELETECLLQLNDSIHCLISSLQKKNAFYLIHWSNMTADAKYDTQISLNLSDALYSMTLINYMGESTQLLNASLNGTSITFTPPSVPCNIQLANTQSDSL